MTLKQLKEKLDRVFGDSGYQLTTVSDECPQLVVYTNFVELEDDELGEYDGDADYDYLYSSEMFPSSDIPEKNEN